MKTLIESKVSPLMRKESACPAFLCATLTLCILGCGGSSSSSSSTNPYVTAYKAATWGDTVKVTYPSSCEMTIATTGQPNYTPNPYYVVPASGSEKVVAYTVSTKTAMALASYADDIEPSLQGSSATINICPQKATRTTAAGLGAIGYLLSGTAMFNPFEADGSTPAIADNATYTFTDSSGTSQTAYFLDQCGSHSNGTTWHAHANPDCVTSEVDTSTGPSHIIGVALDGFPIYGGRDVNGKIIDVSQLDSCNGITSSTPEFPNGSYHYVLPIGVTTKYASINCYSGTVSEQTMAAARKLACNMKTMFAMIHSREADKRKMAGMVMPDGSTMPAGSM